MKALTTKKRWTPLGKRYRPFFAWLKKGGNGPQDPIIVGLTERQAERILYKIGDLAKAIEHPTPELQEKYEIAAKLLRKHNLKPLDNGEYGEIHQKAQEVIADQDQVERWLRKWQPILRLSDWDIRIKLKRSFEMEDDSEGESLITLTRKEALIVIQDPIDFVGRPDWEPDPEQIVVHELIHLHAEPFFPEDRESMEYKAAEQAMDALAKGYVTLDRRPRP